MLFILSLGNWKLYGMDTILMENSTYVNFLELDVDNKPRPQHEVFF